MSGLRARFWPGSRDERIALIGLGLVLLAGGVLRLLFMLAWRPAFIGYPDTGVYIGAASGELFSDPLRPAGYPLFLRLAHDFSAKLSVTILIQHALGIATAVLLFLAVRRVGGPRWLGLLPAAVVLLGGAQMFLEHTPLSDVVFGFLVAAALYTATRLLDEPRLEWTVVLALLLALAATTRTVGLVLLPVFLVWVALGLQASWRRRLLHAGVALLVTGTLLAGYVDAQRDAIGFTGLTRAGMWNLYGRVAPIADCSEFTPPGGTRVLCEEKPVEERPSPEQYIFDATRSPAVQRFGSPFHATQEESDKVGAFTRAVIVGQPLDYAAEVARGMVGYVAPGTAGLRLGNTYEHFFHRVLFDPAFSEQVRQQALPYYGAAARGTHVRQGLLDTLKDYESVTRITGPLMIVLMLLSLTGPLLAKERLRSAAVLFALVAWSSLVAPVAGIWWDARLSVPSLGPLAASSAIGVGALVVAWRTRAQPGATSSP